MVRDSPPEIWLVEDTTPPESPSCTMANPRRRVAAGSRVRRRLSSPSISSLAILMRPDRLLPITSATSSTWRLRLSRSGRPPSKATGQTGNLRPAGFDRPQNAPLGPLGPGQQGLAQSGPIGNHQLRRRRRGGRTAVRYIVCDGKVSFVPYAADHRNSAAEYRPGNYFLVEGPKVLQGSSATGDDNHVGPAVGIQAVQGRGNHGSGIQPLYLGRRKQQPGQGIAALNHILNVLPGRAGGRGDHANDLGKLGKGPLARLFEQSLLGTAGPSGVPVPGPGLPRPSGRTRSTMKSVEPRGS